MNTRHRAATRRFAGWLSALIVASPAFAQQTPPGPPAPPAPPGASAAETPAAPLPLAESLTGSALSDYQAGKILYVDGDYAGALIKFRAAHASSGDPRLLWNMAASEKNLRHYAQALQLLERYEREGAGKLTEQDRADAAGLREALTPFVGRVTVTVDQPGAIVSVDGEEVGKTPLSEPLMMDIGSRVIKITKPGFMDFSTKHSVSGGTGAAVDVKLEVQKTTGTLIVNAGTKDEIRIDGKVAGIGTYTGALSAGKHQVVVRNAGFSDYQSDVVIEAGEREQVNVRLDKKAEEDGGIPAWVWITGGVVVAGLGTGAYFLFRPADEAAPDPVQGTIDPGFVQLPLRY